MRRMMSILVALLVVGMVPGAVAQQQELTPIPAEQQDQRPEAAAPPAVLVLPFTMLGDDAKHDWVGQGIQQNLQAELGRAGLELVGTLQIKPMNRAPVLVRPDDEVVAALKMGAEARADVVIFGNYQVVDDELRVTGRVMDVASGQNVGFLKGSGTLRNLLALEDELAKQALAFFQAVPEGEAVQRVEPAPQQPATEPATAVEEAVVYEEPQIFQPATEVVYSPRYYDDDIDDYDWIGAATYVYPSYYYYPSYSYYYKPYCYRPWYWSSFSIGFHYDRHHWRHHDHDHHHHYYRGHRYGYHRDHHGVIDRHKWDRYDRYRPGRHDDRDDRFRRDGGAVRGRNTIVALDRSRDDQRRLTSAGYRASSSRHAQYLSARGDNTSSSLSRLRSDDSSRRTLTYRGNQYRKDTDERTAAKRDPVKLVSPSSPAKDAPVAKKGERPTSASDDSKKVVRVDRDPFSSRESRGAAREPARDVKRESPPRETQRREVVREPAREPARVAKRDPSPSLRVTERTPSRPSASSSRSSASSRREATSSRSSTSSSGLRSSSSGRSSAAVTSRGSSASRSSSIRSSSSGSRPSSIRSSSSGSRSSSIRSSSSGSRASGSSFRSSSSSSRSSGSSSSRSSGGGSSRGSRGR